MLRKAVYRGDLLEPIEYYIPYLAVLLKLTGKASGSGLSITTGVRRD
jgi:hypothetical protein